MAEHEPSHERENLDHGYRTTDVTSSGTETVREYEYGKYVFSPDKKVSEKVTQLNDD